MLRPEIPACFDRYGYCLADELITDTPPPYFRVFNPTLQGKKFDPHGDYVRRWVPELRKLDSAHIHEPVKAPGRRPVGYPEPIVDHAAERSESPAALQRGELAFFPQRNFAQPRLWTVEATETNWRQARDMSTPKEHHGSYECDVA